MELKEISKIIGKIDEFFCENCQTHTIHQVIFLQLFSDSNSYDEYVKCLECESIQFFHVFFTYFTIEEDEEPFPKIIGLDYIKYYPK